ncbi:flagellar hook-basal body complex protein [Candidatus Regiella endosymbiont of Tuberolachnus salignus]|uniref:flagellar hook-basal body protein n=1 Tax=Candidatus Regiella endosymbiont of Tuberolachnus salignus TaxID=3077956 RepID=UPI0030D4D5D9
MTDAVVQIAQSAVAVLQQKLNAHVQNIANGSTEGYKATNVTSSDSGYYTQRAAGSPVDQNNNSPTGIQYGTGTKIIATERNFSPGLAKHTGEELHVAINGQGFFQVEKAGRLAYTRAGRLQKKDGLLTNAAGLPLDPPINIPESYEELMISGDGTVTAKILGEDDAVELGQLVLFNFSNPNGLEAIGDNLYLATSASGEAVEIDAGEGMSDQIKHKFLEESNVDSFTELMRIMPLTDLMKAISNAVKMCEEAHKYIIEHS